MPSSESYQIGSQEQAAVKETILKAVDAMYNQGDIEAIRRCYHPGYILLVMREDALVSVPLDQRIEAVKKGHERGEYPAKERVSIRFRHVTVAGTAAAGYFEYLRGDKHTCDDLMSLYRFESGWRIVHQTTHHYGD
jgi:hypothetical protein